MLGSFSSCLFKGNQRTLLLIEAEAASPVGRGGGGRECKWERPAQAASAAALPACGNPHTRAAACPSLPSEAVVIEEVCVFPLGRESR